MVESIRRFRIFFTNRFSALPGEGFAFGRGIVGSDGQRQVCHPSGTRQPHREAGSARTIPLSGFADFRSQQLAAASSGRYWAAGLVALSGGLWGGMSLAGGYVAPVVDLLPVAGPTLTAGGPQAWWLAFIPLLLFLLAGRSGGGGGPNVLTPVPPDHGGPCFGEGTLIQLDRGWVPVEAIAAGERIVTSRGIQTILTVESWRPVEFRDRPFVVEGVRLSPNHGVAVGEIIVPACRLNAARSRIDGSRYFHILVADHAWLFAKARPEATLIRAESLCMTADLKLARRFPELVARHAADPVAPIRMSAQDRTTLKAA